jgi:hypothetical protein
MDYIHNISHESEPAMVLHHAKTEHRSLFAGYSNPCSRDLDGKPPKRKKVRVYSGDEIACLDRLDAASVPFRAEKL